MAKSKSVKTVTTPKTSATKIKPVRLNHTQKLVTVMISGKVVTSEEIEALLGDQIQCINYPHICGRLKLR